MAEECRRVRGRRYHNIHFGLKRADPLRKAAVCCLAVETTQDRFFDEAERDVVAKTMWKR